MNILTFLKHPITVFIICLFSISNHGQTHPNKIKQDPRFEKLLNEKRKINGSLSQHEGFKIQIFSGDNEAAKKTLAEFRKSNKSLDATIIFHTPIYKVWIGSFKTRIEAEKKLLEIQKKYNNAFLVNPNKNK